MSKAAEKKLWGHDDILAVIEKHQTLANPATQVYCHANCELVVTSIGGAVVHESDENYIVLSNGAKVPF